MDAANRSPLLSRFEQLRFAREIIRAEGDGLLALASRLTESFCDAVDLLARCRGSIVVTGMGKAGIIGQKVAATLASTGTRSQYLHPGEAIHGDLGRVRGEDIVVVFSFSGETEEVVRLLPSFEAIKTPVIAVTGNEQSSLGRAARLVIPLGPLREACPLGLAPTTSTTAMLALGDALALVLSRLRQFEAADFARLHPGGSLGRKLARVDEVARPLSECRVARESQPVREVLVTASKPGRRSGAILLVDLHGRLSGIFTDSDLARLLEGRHEVALDQPIHEVMTRSPLTIETGAPMPRAVEIFVQRKISELPVVDRTHRPLGVLDITDVVGWLPPPDSAAVASDHGSPPAPAGNGLTEGSVPGRASSGADVPHPATIPFPNRGPQV